MSFLKRRRSPSRKARERKWRSQMRTNMFTGEERDHSNTPEEWLPDCYTSNVNLDRIAEERDSHKDPFWEDLKAQAIAYCYPKPPRPVIKPSSKQFQEVLKLLYGAKDKASSCDGENIKIEKNEDQNENLI